MKLLLYAAESKPDADRLLESLALRVPRKEMEVHRSIESLSRRLRQPRNGMAIALFLTTSRTELEEIISLQGLLEDLRLVLVLPDGAKETVARGLTLRPRFHAFADTDYAEVAMVLDKMLRLYADDLQSPVGGGRRA